MMIKLMPYFEIIDKGKEWHLFCKKCSKGYALKKTYENKIGENLTLLNHAFSHENKKGG